MSASRILQQSPSRTFESLYRRHLSDVYRYSLALLDRPADAEDATQATFLNAYRAIERGERPRDSRRWLRSIALNVCREHWRRASRRPDEVSLEEDPGKLVADEPTPAIGEVIRALSKLPFNQRAALVMREFEGRSLNEIAVALEVTGAAVESLLFRGRRALREQLDGSIRCHQAEELISRQLDGRIGYTERGRLRAHLRECEECTQLARRLRAQRKAIKSLALVPVPAGLSLTKLGLPAPAHAAAAGSAGGAAQASGGALFGLAGTSAAVKIGGAAILAVAALGVGYGAIADHARRAKATDVRARSPIASVSPKRPGAPGLFGIGAGLDGAKLAAARGRRPRAGTKRHGLSSSATGRRFAHTGAGGAAQRYGASFAGGSASRSIRGAATGRGNSGGAGGGHQHRGAHGNGHGHSNTGSHPVHPVTSHRPVPPVGGGGHGHHSR
jgi:RNA polymerase sigma factor (sigma-70 family)